MAGPKAIDACAFLGPWPYSGYGIEDPRRLIEELDAHGIGTAVVSATDALFGDVNRGNTRARAAAATHPGRFLPLCTTFPLHRRDFSAALRQWVSDGFRGIRLWPQHHGYRLTDAAAAKMFRAIEDSGLPVFLSVRAIANWGLAELPLDGLPAFIAAYPKLQVVIGGFNYDSLPRLIELGAAHSNVWFEISCLQMRDPVEALVQLAGPSRILLGTGTPLQYTACGLVKVRQARLPRHILDAVSFGNAQRLFG